jgi:hypothetical protein
VGEKNAKKEKEKKDETGGDVQAESTPAHQPSTENVRVQIVNRNVSKERKSSTWFSGRQVIRVLSMSV